MRWGSKRTIAGVSVRRNRHGTARDCPEFLSWRGVVVRLLAATLIASGFLVVRARADIIHGQANFNIGGFDFGSQSPTSDPYQADIWLVNIFDPPLGWLIQGYGAGLKLVADSTLTELMSAPVDSSEYGFEVPVQLGVAYVVSTFDGFYAKFAMVDFVPYVKAEFEYYFQPDGTTNLATPVDT